MARHRTTASRCTDAAGAGATAGYSDAPTRASAKVSLPWTPWYRDAPSAPIALSQDLITAVARRINPGEGGS